VPKRNTKKKSNTSKVRNAKETNQPRTGKKKKKASEFNLIKRTLRVMFRDEEEIIEVRALDVQVSGRRRTASGFFDNRAYALTAIRRLEKRGASGNYINLHKISPALLGRARNRIEYFKPIASKDEDVIARKYLLVDIDPERPAGTSASEDEVQHAKAKVNEVRAELDSELGAPSIVAFSGNGYHLLYEVDLPNDKASSEIFKDCLKILSDRYSDDNAKIDTAVYNASRIVRLYGTFARKGDEIPEQDRVHRRSKIIETNESILTCEQLRTFVANNKQFSTSSCIQGRIRWPWQTAEEFFEYLAERGVEVAGIKSAPRERTVINLAGCPIHPEHGYNKDTGIIWSPDNIGFNCFHNSCQDYSWIDVLAQIHPAWRRDLQVTPTKATQSPKIAYEPFPLDSLPDQIALYVAKSAKAIGCDPAMIAVPIISALAAAIDNTRVIEVKPGWKEPSVVWTTIVGESGTQKSPALDKALEFTQELERLAFDEFYRAKAKYDADMKIYREAKKKDNLDGMEEPVKPELKRYIVRDITIESLAERQEEGPRGLLLFSEEISQWYRGIERYGKGQDAGPWLCMHGARPYSVDRKTSERKLIYVKQSGLSITGSIQPGVLESVFDQQSFEAGVMARMLMVYPPKQRRRWSEHSVTGVFVNIVESTFSNLYALELESDQPKALRFKSDAKEIWIKFFNEHGNEQFHLSGDLASAWSKLEGYVARFALIIELSKWASKEKASAPPKYISVDSIESAIKLGRWFCRETERVYSIFGRNQHSPSVERDIKNVVQSDGPITERDISRRLGAIDKDVIERTLYQMVERRILKREDSPAGAPGRPTCSYTINEADFIDETPENGGYDEVLTSLMAKHGFIDHQSDQSRKKRKIVKKRGATTTTKITAKKPSSKKRKKRRNRPT